MARRGWGATAVVAVLVTVAAACSGTPADGGGGASTATVAPAPGVTTTGTSPPGTAPSGTGAPTTPLEAVSTPEPFQAEPADGACTLHAGRTDLGDLPTGRLPPMIGSFGEERPVVPDAFGSAPGVAVSLEPQRIDGIGPDFAPGDPEGRWLALSRIGAVLVDPATTSIDAVLHVGDSCWVHELAASGDRLAAVVCTGDPSSAAPEPCALVVSDRSGATIGRWAADTTFDLTWAEDQLVLAQGGSDGTDVVIIDPGSGVGSRLALDGCDPGPTNGSLVTGTTVVTLGCGQVGGAPQPAVDAATGTVVLERVGPRTLVQGPDPAWWPLGTPRRDVGSGALLPAVPPEVVAELEPAQQGPVLAATETTTGIWVERCLGPCADTLEIELLLLDRDGTTVDRWVLAALPAGRYRGSMAPSAIARPIYDATGAWVPVDGRIVRLSSVR